MFSLFLFAALLSTSIGGNNLIILFLIIITRHIVAIVNFESKWILKGKVRFSYRFRGGLGGVVVIDAAFGAHGKSRPRFKPGTLLLRCSDLGQVVNLSLSVA